MQQKDEVVVFAGVLEMLVGVLAHDGVEAPVDGHEVGEEPVPDGLVAAAVVCGVETVSGRSSESVEEVAGEICSAEENGS